MVVELVRYCCNFGIDKIFGKTSLYQVWLRRLSAFSALVSWSIMAYSSLPSHLHPNFQDPRTKAKVGEELEAVTNITLILIHIVDA